MQPDDLEDTLQETLAAALINAGADIDASECHGLVAGLICSKGHLSAEEWFARVAEETPGAVYAAEEKEVLGRLLDQTSTELGDTLMSFRLLLPAEDAPLAERTAALGHWCEGFLLGLSAGDVPETSEMPHDTAEAVHDLTEIAGAGEYGLDDAEEDEAAYAELVEYVRTAVLLINEELNPTKAPPRSDTVLH